jgi:hypothetical protein
MSMRTTLILWVLSTERRLRLLVWMLLKSLKLHSVAPEFAMIENMRMARQAMPLVVIVKGFETRMGYR